MIDDPRRAVALAALRAAEGAVGLQGVPAAGTPAGPAGRSPAGPKVRSPATPERGASAGPEDEAPDEPGSGSPADPEAIARAIVLRQLTIAPRSRAQLERKLADRGCDPAVAARVLDRMEQVGLVDDAAYAEQFVQSQRRGKGLSGAALRRQLRDKGVDDDIATDAVGGLDSDSERARAEQLAATRMRSLAGLDPQVQARRLAAMLTRKGYPPGVVYPVVREVVNSAPEHARD